jgi:hypothetical protein
VWSGLQPAITQGQPERIRRVRSAVEACQKQIREIIATGILPKKIISTETISLEQTP